MKAVMLPQAGGCVCGAMRYNLTGAPLLAFVCHCHDCQTRSGAAFSLTLVVHTVHVAVIGAPKVARRATRSGREVDHILCPACGTSLLASAPVAPDYTSIVAGTLDDARWIRPIAQTFVESAIPWAIIPGVRQVRWADFDYVTLGREWTVSAPRFEPCRK